MNQGQNLKDFKINCTVRLFYQMVTVIIIIIIIIKTINLHSAFQDTQRCFTDYAK